ncbi:hypothetical protein BDZ45DRAFT_750223 [Acephala macrosclerotiorum]|nr:hypothetical protein BDZ45DRAFT_750223 [Acephala macrosclerotiorum]
MAKEYPYEVVHAMLLTWEESGKHIEQEAEQLASVLSEDYSLTSVTSMKMSSKCFESFITTFTRWVCEHSKPDTLLILHYGGHGYTNEEGRLVLGPYDDAFDIGWKFFQETLHEFSSSDVLVLLDSCHAAAAANEPCTGPQKENTTMEFITACGSDQTAPISATCSFNKALMLALKKWSTRHSAFSATALHQEITSQIRRWNSHGKLKYPAEFPDGVPAPIYFCLPASQDLSPILLKSLKPRVLHVKKHFKKANRLPGMLGSGFDYKSIVFSGWSYRKTGYITDTH